MSEELLSMHTSHTDTEPTSGAPGFRRMLSILRIRDFRLLWTGLTVSFLGDGIYFVALAWEVYRISNAPSALSAVGVAWTLPLVLFVLLGGVVADRFDRRHVMIASDIMRGISMLGMGALSVTGQIELWHVYVLVAIYGSGEAFFGPAFGAIVPQVVPKHRLVEANALDSLVDPLCFKLAGPALGGLMVAGFGAGPAFLANAVTFAVSGLAVSLMRPRPADRENMTIASSLREIKEGFLFVKSRVWLWATLCSAAICLLAFWGPLEVLLPYIVKNELGGSAGDYGTILAVGGVGAVLTSLTMGARGLPRRHITFMYCAWGIGIGIISLYGVATVQWQLMVVAFLSGGGIAAGLIVWKTLLHRLVPQELLGRVTSFDWFISIGLVPLSFAITGPAAEAFGARTTMVGAGLIATVLTFAFLLVPGIRDTERDGSLDAIEPPSETSDVSMAELDDELVRS
jgi:MFS family permease